MKLVSMELKNYRRYEHQIITFPEGLIGIVGKNGSGKSTLIEAIAWCLYGSDVTRRRKGDIRRTESGETSECKVIVELMLGSDAIRIERGIRGRNAQASARLFLNGSTEAAITGVREVTEEITSRTRMDYVSFFTSVFAKQNELAALSGLPNAKRKVTIMRLLRINDINEVITSIRFDINRSKEMQEFFQNNVEDLDKLEKQLAAFQTNQKVVLAEIKKMENNLKILQKECDLGEQNFIKLEKKYKEHNIINTEIANLNGQILNAEKEKGRANDDLAVALESKQKLIEIQPQLEKFEKIKIEKENLDSIKLKYIEKCSVESRFNDCRQQADAKNQEMEQLIAELDAYDEIDEETRSVSQKLTSLKQNSEVKKIEEGAIQAQINEKTTQKKKIQQEFDDFKSLGDESKCPKCFQPLNKQHMESLTKSYATEIQKLEKSIEDNFEEKVKISNEIKIIFTNLQLEEANEESVNDKIKKRDKLRIGIDIGKKTLSTLQSQQVKISLELEEYKNIQYDDEEYSKIISEFNKLEEIRTRSIELNTKVSTIPDLKTRIELIEKNISKIDQDIIIHNTELEKISFNEAEYEKAKKTKTETEKQFYKQKEIISEQKQNIQRIEDNISHQEEKIKTEEQRRDMIKESGSKINSLSTLVDFMIDFKMHLISRIKPQLSSATSELFRQMTNGKYSAVELDDNYSITINDRGKNHPIDRFSGGESDLANLCLRIAISQELSRRAGGLGIQFIALDEIFGSQDEERKSNILQALNELSHQFHQILLITHVEDVKESLPYVFHIKENADNTVSVEEEGDFAL